MSVGELLPSNSDVFEQALAYAMSDELPVEYEQILDPYQTPVEFLPFLAAHHSVDLWFADWTEEKKREMVAQCAGVSTTYPGEPLADLKGTFEGLKRYLWFVDATVLERVSYPQRFVIGQSPIGITPINHPPYKGRYLIKTTLEKPFNAFVIGQSAIGKSAIRNVSTEPIRRARLAARIAKAEHCEYTVSSTHRTILNFGDDVSFDDELSFGTFLDRTSLASLR